MSSALAVITGDIYGAKEDFERRLSDKSISFEREAGFAIQILQQNDYALGLATKNRQSVVDAVTNVAAIGISLNPAKKQAYLVPRDGKICLDISYMGLIDLATATGSIKWAKAAIVHQNDRFALNGYDKPPEHQFNPFGGDRGDPVGAYVVVKTADGDYLTEAMSVAEINEIRDRSTAWKAWVEKKKKCPWVTDWGEMAKKTVIKRAYKTWPKTDRLDEAIHHLNTDGEEGLAELVTRADDRPGFDRAAWIDKANKATTPDELQVIWKQGADAARKAADRDGYDKFKTVVTNAVAKLKAVDAEVKEEA